MLGRDKFERGRKMKTKMLTTLLVLLLALVVGQGQAAPMGTEFTYQGRLIDANDAADGEYDFQFKLYDNPSAGTQQGSTICLGEVDVIDGYFTVGLDFGSGVFDGDARWLQIGVRPGEQNDPNVYTVLEPRQEVTPTPYALYAPNAEQADTLDGQDGSYYQNASNLNAGTISEARLPQNAIDSSEIQDNSLTASDIATGAVGSSEIADNSITQSDIATNGVGAAEIAADAVGSSEIAANAVGASEIAANAVDSSELTSAYSSGSAYDSRFVNEGQANSINTGMIASGTTVSGSPSNAPVFTVHGTYSAYGLKGVAENNYGVWGVSEGSTSWSWAVHGEATAGGVGGRFSSQSGYGLIVSKGKVGLGTTSPSEQLDVDGTARLRGISAAAGATYVHVDGNGKLWKIASSKRYKTNIQDLTTDPHKVLELRPVRFQCKTTGQEDIGLIAEETEEVLKDLVIYDNEGRPDAVKYDRVAIYLLGVVKTQQDKIAALEERIVALENTQNENIFVDAKEVKQ